MNNATPISTEFNHDATPLWLALLACLVLLNLPSLLNAVLNTLVNHDTNMSSNITHGLQMAVYAVVPWMIIRIISHHYKCQVASTLNRLGMSCPLPLGAIGLGIALGITTTISTTLLGNWLNATPDQNTLALLEHHPSFLGMISLGFVVMIGAPLIEEILFRGWLYPIAAKTCLGSFGAALFISSLFTVLHINPTIQSIALFSVFSLAMISCFLRYHYQSLWPAIALHISFNSSQWLGLVFMNA